MWRSSIAGDTPVDVSPVAVSPNDTAQTLVRPHDE